MILLPTAGLCAAVTLTWDANSEADLAGYKVYSGTSSRNYSDVKDVGNTNTATISNLTDGQTYYFAVTAYDTEGLESGYSNEVAYEPAVAVTTYTITSSAGAHGSISPSGSVTVARGGNQSFTITPASGYQIDDVVVDGNSVGAVGSYAFSNVTADHTISASFSTTILTYTIGASAGSNGSISPSGSVTVARGGSQSFTITPASGYQIDDVVVDGNSVGVVSSYTFSNVTGDHTIAASFEADPNVADTDGDGLPDAWEQQYGLNPAANDADDDPDRDGITNLNEYLGGTDPTQPDADVNPDAPQLISPADYDLVALEPSLQVGEFYDPDAGDIHGETEWKIFRESDGTCMFDLRSQSALTSVTVPAMILDAQVDYTWQVRFYDNHGRASEWSASGYFTTQEDGADIDDNGIPDDQQVDLTVDLDGNGTYDLDQADIKSVRVDGKNTLIGLSAGDSSEVLEISALRSEDPDNKALFPDMTGKPGATPFGLLNFKVLVNQPGESAELTVYFSESVPEEGAWYKYDSVNKRWDDFSDYAILSPDGKSLTLYLEDGGEGDADGVANGVIVDPSGLVVVDGGNTTSGGGGGAGGCFIEASKSTTRHQLRESNDSLGPVGAVAIWLTIMVFFGYRPLIAVCLRVTRKFFSPRCPAVKQHIKRFH